MSDFSVKEFGEVDSLILSQFSYLFFDGIVPGLKDDKDAVPIKDTFLAERFASMLHNVRVPDDNKRLLAALSSNPRYRNVGMNYYVNEIDIAAEKQFSAVSFLLDRNTAYIAFRGTDASLVGWKEDFNMAFLSEVPSQARAVQYLEKVSQHLPYDLIVGGHSKGGNLAVYSAMMCCPALQRRIAAVYSHDGPGFHDHILKSTHYQRIKDRVHKTVPQSSVIGMLLETQEDYTVVKSNRSGMMQHDPFSWEIGEDGFHQLQHITSRSQFLDKTLHDWLLKLPETDRERFVDTLYKVIAASNAATIAELQQIRLRDIKTMLAVAGNIDTETRKFLFNTVKSLIVLSIGNILPRT